MTFARPTLLQIAFHDAGHAYAFASIVLGGAPVELGVEQSNGGWYGWTRRRLKVAETEQVHEAFQQLGEDAALRWIASAEAAIGLAGPLAEARQREGSSAAGLTFLALALPQLLDDAHAAIDQDFARIRRMVAIVHPKAPVEAARQLALRTNKLLDACWPAVGRLARRLVTERHLGEAALEEHFARWPARRPALRCDDQRHGCPAARHCPAPLYRERPPRRPPMPGPRQKTK